MKEPWSIKSRARECAATGTPFETGQKIRAAIFPDPDSSGYLRKDFLEVEEDEAHTENARYILAVMLERKKLLRETDTQEVPSGILRVYEHRKTGDVYLIKDPQIPLSDVEKVQAEVKQLLDPEPELEPAAAEASEAPALTEENKEEK